VKSRSSSLPKLLKISKDECLMTFSMVGRGGKVIQKCKFPTSRHITITEDPVKFQEMFDMAMHHALVNQSNDIGPCYSQPVSSVAAASRAVASATAGIGSQPMAPSTASASTRSIPMPVQFSQSMAFQPVGTPVQSASAYATSSSTITSASRNLFNTPSGYVPTSSFGMPSEMMAGVWPQSHSTAGQMGFNQGAPPSPQRSLLLVTDQQPQQQTGGPQASPSATQPIAPCP